MQVRELTVDDLPAAWDLGRLAFGSAATSAPEDALVPHPGVITRYGAFDADGRLLGRAIDVHDEQWWAGRRLVAADVGGVAVLPEARGRGVARALLTALLAGARERGAAVSALFPTVAAPYRSCGWEVGGSLRTVDLPTAALARHRPAEGYRVRPGDKADLPAVRDLYAELARHRCGLLTRVGGRFDRLADNGLPEGIDGLTVVERDGRLVGYTLWERGEGYDHRAVLTVDDIQAADAGAARELIGVLASWRSVAPTLRLRPPAFDAVVAQLPVEATREHRQQTWMHRPVDVVRAVEGRGWPRYASGSLDFGLDDPIAPWNSGSWRLTLADGAATLRRLPDEVPLRLSVRGFALLYTGAADAAAVLAAGLAEAGAGADPTALDLLAAGPRAELLDYF
ncbi:GNAT family N-acetyltransferase [Micromonospora zhanjiangensis]|uniref:Enhanced intracellular survival protein Eis n=1 Tax=Micromonospora zhanjiangensis TaxID=1522057 RepID=A0ABV8KHK2_9ACTN